MEALFESDLKGRKFSENLKGNKIVVGNIVVGYVESYSNVDGACTVNLGNNITAKMELEEVEAPFGNKSKIKRSAAKNIIDHFIYAMVIEVGDEIRVSRRSVQEKFVETYIKNLPIGTVINAKVYDVSIYGVFVDIGYGTISLITLPDMTINKYIDIKDLKENVTDLKVAFMGIENRCINITHKQLLGTWEQNVKMFKEKESYVGYVRNVKNGSALIEMAPNLVGIANAIDGLDKNDKVLYFIKNVNYEKHRVKLFIISIMDKDGDYERKLSFKYFETERVDKNWEYK